MSLSLHGVAVSRGVAIGNVHLVEHNQLDVTEVRLPPEDVEAEVARLHDAVSLAKDHLRQIREHIPDSTPLEIAGFIDTHLLMLDDAAFSEEPARMIRETQCNAEWAVKLQRDALIAVFDEMDDAYLKTRRDDVYNVVDRILRNLMQLQPLSHDVAGRHLRGMIILASDISPADLIMLQHHDIAGFVTEFGGPTSHVSILARSLGIPAVAGVHHARRYIKEDELLIVDGDDGVIVGDPDDGILGDYRQRQASRLEYLKGLDVLREQVAVTEDGVAIELHANAEFESDFSAAIDIGADGIGLYRTEFLFMNRSDYPDEHEHFEHYRKMLAVLDGLPLTIRTADIGADKPVDQIDAGPLAANPALGLRAVRLCLHDPALFLPQLRAVIRASALGPVRMMIPMLSSVEEVYQVLEIVRGIHDDFREQKIEFDESMPIGGMIEVPAAAVSADLFSEELDFLSIGTNDLIQYAVAIDRVNDEVSYLYDPLNPGVLRLIATTIEAGENAGIPVAMCGEMAGDPRYTRLLLGLGLREFSVHPSSLLEIKHVITRSNLVQVRELAAQLLRAKSAGERNHLLGQLEAEQI